MFTILYACLTRMKRYRYLDGLRALGEVLLDSLESFGAVSFLCLLFLLVFSILGLHLFGEIELDITFPNFNSFFNAFITVFQVCYRWPLYWWFHVSWSLVVTRDAASSCEEWGAGMPASSSMISELIPFGL